MQNLLGWWERGLVFALGLSVALLGVGRIELSGAASFSSWSVSRTTFFFWLVFKLTVAVRAGWSAACPQRLKTLAPLYVFFVAVSVSLLPDLRIAGDYRYFLFGCAHSIMVVDLFSRLRQKRWLPIVCGLLPAVAVVRGVIEKPAVFSFVLEHRFAFPLDHANTAGYVFAMSIPLALAVALAGTAFWRRLGGLSLVSQAGALLLTYSRGAWLGCGAALLFFAAAGRKWRPLAAMVFFAALCLLLVPSMRERLYSMGRPGDDASLSQRSQLFSRAVQLGVDHPLRGVGYGRGRLKESLRPYLQGTPLEGRPIWHSHNVYAELFAGTGLLGLGAFLWLLGSVLFRLTVTAARQHGAGDTLGWALAASWIAAIVGGIGDIPFYHHETRMFFFTLIGVAQLYWISAGKDPAL